MHGLALPQPLRITPLLLTRAAERFHSTTTPPQAVAATRAAVLDSNADLGIMLDTDVDRSGVVDRNGNGGCWVSRVV